YYFLGLISQTIFLTLLSFAQITGNSHVKPAKRVFYKRILQASSQKSGERRVTFARVKRKRVVKNRAFESERSLSAGKMTGGLRLARQRDAIISVTGLLGFFSLDTLVDLFTVDRYFFRSVNTNTYLVTLYP